ncbi:MAG TPA: Gmad2 immunoglobulin-like domain-containing protein [Candidatus Bathyarchaeia archaeon]|nr:Gmad2 immunoglobulin-like domain-containing protein [Candidatus Bathyarchaeia archaeon]
MRRTLLTLTVLVGLVPALTGCMSEQNATPPTPPPTTEPAPSAQPQQPETPAPSAEQPDQVQQPSEQPPAKPTDPPTDNANKNDIFQDVTVTKTGEDTYQVKGKAKIFEAVVEYVVEDGHNELASGTAQASKGAPEWGDFTIDLHVKKDQPNSTLMLILFETSAKDGSRQNELAIALPQ